MTERKNDVKPRQLQPIPLLPVRADGTPYNGDWLPFADQCWATVERANADRAAVRKVRR